MATLTVWQDAVSCTYTFTPPLPLHAVLRQAHHAHFHPCGGRGVCRKCAVTLTGAVSEPNAAEQAAGVRLSCQAVLLGDAEVWLDKAARDEQIQTDGALSLDRLPLGKAVEGTLGAAVDIGTTTLAVKLYDLKTGALLSHSEGPNPQRAVAADVMGRIQAALDGAGEALQQQITAAVRERFADACRKAGRDPSEIDNVVAVGNTTMLYLLTGRSPHSLATAPFIADERFDKTVSLWQRDAYLPPCMSAFVGADITAAVLASGMCDRHNTALLCDIGTNGELALWKDGVLYVTSTAAGPAFEGAGITCGCGSVAGAIDRVQIVQGHIATHTIGNAAPVGLCGSGLIDAVAAGLALGWIDETGAMEEPSLNLSDTVALFPQDVRAVQLAKAAIAAGIDTLLAVAEITPQDVETLYIAGGFGSHLSVDAAVAVGLIPDALATRVAVVGNAALDGAALLLADPAKRDKARAIAKTAAAVELGGNAVFNRLFVEKMMFE